MFGSINSTPNLGFYRPIDINTELVSVIIPTFNRAGLVGEAIESVAAQTHRSLEVIVVDDGSTDETASAVDCCANSCRDGMTVKYVRQEHRGVSAARNKGLAECRGAFLQYLDSDDLLHPRKIELQLDEFGRNPGFDFVYSASARFCMTPSDADFPYVGFRTDDYLPGFLRGRLWCTISGLYRRALCDAIGPWDESLHCWEDWEYHVRLCLATESIGYVPGALSLVRRSRHPQITASLDKPEIITAGASALAKIKAAVEKHGRLAERGIADALAIGFFQMARRAATIGDGKIHCQLMNEASSLCGRPLTRLLLAIWRAARSVLGLSLAGRLLESLLEFRRMVFSGLARLKNTGWLS